MKFNTNLECGKNISLVEVIDKKKIFYTSYNLFSQDQSTYNFVLLLVD